ncbi:MAG: TIGR00730 family Rossman fold protein [Ferruginibacter sp.]
MSIKSLAVFCGSKSGSNPLFEKHALQLGHIMAAKKITLIYGGGNKGIMGAVANAVLEKNGTVTGIIPQLLTDREHSHHGITELIVVENMHVRKKMLYEKCDAAIILPGGFGTLDELFEMLTWNQLSIHDKKIFILNTAGFYDNLLTHARTMQDSGFLYDDITERITVISDPGELESML